MRRQFKRIREQGLELTTQPFCVTNKNCLFLVARKQMNE